MWCVLRHMSNHLNLVVKQLLLFVLLLLLGWLSRLLFKFYRCRNQIASCTCIYTTHKTTCKDSMKSLENINFSMVNGNYLRNWIKSSLISDNLLNKLPSLWKIIKTNYCEHFFDLIKTIWFARNQARFNNKGVSWKSAMSLILERL